MVKNDDIDYGGENMPHEVKMVIFGIVAFICGVIFLIFIFGSWYTISAGYKGVVLTFGKPSVMAVGEGLHFKIPLVQKVIKMDTRTQKYEAELTAASSDLQDVKTKIAINYHLNPESVPELYRTIGLDYATNVIYPLEQESNKAATAQFTAVELITKREQVRESMKTTLRDKLVPRGIIVEDISIVDFAFSASFTQAIELKVTAEQNALAAKNKLEQIKYEAEQTVVSARGQAEAIKIQMESLKQNGGDAYIKLKALENQAKYIEVLNNKWSGTYPNVLMGGGSSNLLLDVSSYATNMSD